MAETDDNEPIELAFNRFKAFELVTKGLSILDDYKQTSEKSHLSKARKALEDAQAKFPENEDLHFRVKYFLGMIKYLDGNEAKETPQHFIKLAKETTNKTIIHEIYYNAGAAFYSQRDYEASADHFKTARDAKEATPEVRLLAGAGVALSRAKQHERRNQFFKTLNVLRLSLKLAGELVVNFFRRLVGARHVERALSRKARALIFQALQEAVRRSSPPTPKTPVSSDQDPHPTEPPKVAGAT